MNTKNQGFTLIELIIVVAIIGLLAGIAFPAYNDYVDRARRGDAKAAILEIQLAEEKWRTYNTAYTGTLSDLGLGSTSSDGYYTLALSNAGASTYSITATPTGKQSGDKCGKFTLNQDGNKGVTDASSGYTATKCW